MTKVTTELALPAEMKQYQIPNIKKTLLKITLDYSNQHVIANNES